jgi:hypothetical protein
MGFSGLKKVLAPVLFRSFWQIWFVVEPKKILHSIQFSESADFSISSIL